MSSYGVHAVIPPNKNTFHELLRRTRQEADQTDEVMAVVLNMSAEEYRDLETWKYPDEETLKRLCLMMEWNYYDTQRLIINEMISPHRGKIDIEPGSVCPEFVETEHFIANTPAHPWSDTNACV